MPVSKTISKKRTALPAGKATKLKPGRASANANTKAKTGTATIGSIGFHLLADQLKPKSYFEILMTGGVSLSEYKDKADVFKMVDTEDKQLQCIVDLYSIMKAQPCYKKLTEPNWKADASPVEIIQWLLRKLGPLAKGNYWTIDTYIENGITRYQFVVYNYYRGDIVKADEEIVCLDFLPLLKKRDEALHDLLIDVVALTSKCNKIPFWNEDGDFSEGLEDLAYHESSDIETIFLQHEDYFNGLAADYLLLLKQRRKTVTLAEVKAKIDAYSASSERKRMARWWAIQGLNLARTKRNISKCSWVPNYLSGDIVTPFRMYKYVWSLHQHDFLKNHAYHKLAQDTKVGYKVPVKFSITKPGQRVKAIDAFDYYPENLANYMCEGWKHFTHRYEQYYYRNLLNGQETPSTSLYVRNEIQVTTEDNTAPGSPFLIDILENYNEENILVNE